MSTYYIGSFPPPYGGVTTKNEMLFSALEKKIGIERVTISHGLLAQVWELAEAILFGSSFVVGLGSNSKLGLLTDMLAVINRRAMRKSIVFAMGGSLHTYIASKPILARNMRLYSRIYVESESMLDVLRTLGLENVALFPNCRIKPKDRSFPKRVNGTLKCLFFAKICKEKGAEIALEVGRRLPNIKIEFWGEFESKEYKDYFLTQLNEVPNCEYRGIFKERGNQLFDFISEYDLLLFPSLWKHEGVAGTLVEAKIAGVPAVAFDNNYNSEVVKKSIEGDLIPAGDVERFIASVETFDVDRDRLYRMAMGAFDSADRYFLDTYLEDIYMSVGFTDN